MNIPTIDDLSAVREPTLEEEAAVLALFGQDYDFASNIAGPFCLIADKGFHTAQKAAGLPSRS